MEQPGSFPAFPSADEREFYKLYQERIAHEDNLISARLSWLLTTQSILFTFSAITFFSKERASVAGSSLVATLGILICLLLFLGIRAALVTIDQLTELYRLHQPHPHPMLPPITAQHSIHYRGAWAANYLPWCFILGWLCVLLALAGVFGP